MILASSKEAQFRLLNSSTRVYYFEWTANVSDGPCRQALALLGLHTPGKLVSFATLISAPPA